jgi:hypothetical protein
MYLLSLYEIVCLLMQGLCMSSFWHPGPNCLIKASMVLPQACYDRLNGG